MLGVVPAEGVGVRECEGQPPFLAGWSALLASALRISTITSQTEERFSPDESRKHVLAEAFTPQQLEEHSRPG